MALPDFLKKAPKPKHVLDAYRELSPKAFGAWIMLQFATRVNLSSFDHLSFFLRMSTPSTHVVVKQLERKGYVDTEEGEVETDRRTVLRLRASIAGRNSFVKLV